MGMNKNHQRILWLYDGDHLNHPFICQAAEALGLIYHLSLRPPSGSYANAHLGPYMAYLHMLRRKLPLREELRVFVGRLKERKRTRP